MPGRSLSPSLCLLLLLLTPRAVPVLAQDRLCDPGGENCRAILLDLIERETVAIDVAFWFMEDARYTTALIRKYKSGVPVRVLIDTRANETYPNNAARLAELQTAGIPMRRRLTNTIFHWKMMLFHGQQQVQFSGANYSADAWRPTTAVPYENYVDESIFFTGRPSTVSSFISKFDDLWVDTSTWANHANITGPLVRREDPHPIDPELNFPPSQLYRQRAVSAYNTERRQIDVIMYRITDRAHTDALLNARQRGVRVRLIGEPESYRDVTRLWHSWNVDRLYMGGVEVKHRAHAGLNHQKSVVLYDQDGTSPGDQPMVIFGSSNWSSPGSSGPVEHNMFTRDVEIAAWFIWQFERKWENSAGVIENTAFVPLLPDTPKSPAPATAAINVATTPTLKWFGGPWAHLYDLYIGTNSTLSDATVYRDLAETGAKTATSTFSFKLPVALNPSTTYYWKVVGKTMALRTKASPIWSFTTVAGPEEPTAPAEIVLYASRSTDRAGAWQTEADATAADGARIRHPNAGAAKITTASAAPANYFEVKFYALAGRGYRLWVRGKADSNNWANDSVFVQFTNSTDSAGTPLWRINSTSAAEVNLEECSGCGVSGWGWQDNGYGANTLGPLIYFTSSGWQTLRVQTREDGLSIDQIVLSHTAYVSRAPGAMKNDTVKLVAADGTAQ